MILKKYLPKTFHQLLLPGCLLFGIALLLTFVSLSQDYLSEYLVENSKTLLGQKLDLSNVGNHLNDPRLKTFTQSPNADSVTLVFWSSSCAPCLKDLSQLSLKNPQTLIVPINTDEKTELENAQNTLKNLAPEFPFLHDSNKFLEESLKITYLPTHVLIDRDGFIRKFSVGANR